MYQVPFLICFVVLKGFQKIMPHKRFCEGYHVVCDQGYFAVEDSGINLVAKIGIQIMPKGCLRIQESFC
jgi:hypothetical protein